MVETKKAPRYRYRGAFWYQCGTIFLVGIAKRLISLGFLSGGGGNRTLGSQNWGDLHSESCGAFCAYFSVGWPHSFESIPGFAIFLNPFESAKNGTILVPFWWTRETRPIMSGWYHDLERGQHMAIWKDDKRGWMWKIRAYDPVKKKKRQIKRKATSQTKRGAEQELARVRVGIADGSFWYEEYPDHFAPDKSESMTFREYVEGQYIPKHVPTLAESTKGDVIGALKNHAFGVFGDVVMSDLGAKEIDALNASLIDKDLAAKTRRNILGYIQACLNKAEKWELVTKAPDVELPRVPDNDPDWLSKEEVKRLLVAASEDKVVHHFIVLAINSGMRLGEMLVLDWDCVSFERRTIHVTKSFCRKRGTKPTKSSRNRTVPMTKNLEAHLKSLGGSNGPVMPTEDGEHHTGDMLKRGVKKAWKGAELNKKGRRWHILRHTYASLLVQNGVSLYTVCKLLGHSDVRVTSKYAHLAPNKLHEEVAVLDF